MLFIFPPFGIPVALLISASVCITFDIMHRYSEKFIETTYIRTIFACTLLSFAISFFPATIKWSNNSKFFFNSLLEDYVCSLIFYTPLFQLFGMIWYVFRLNRKISINRILYFHKILILLIVFPFLLYLAAQTSRLHAAAELNDINAVKQALKPWKFIDGIDKYGKTPLQIAVEHNNFLVAAFLIDNGAKLWPAPYKSGTRTEFTDYLNISVKHNSIETIQVLIDKGFPIHKSHALYSATESLNLTIVDILLSGGADPNASIDHLYADNGKEQHRMRPALFSLPSCKDDDQRIYQIISTFLIHGADINYYPEYGLPFIARYLYCPKINEKIIRFIINNGYKLTPNKKGITPLGYAAGAYNIEAVKILLDAGADVNDYLANSSQNYPGRTTALHKAAYLSSTESKFRSAEVVEYLLNKGANPNVFDEYGLTPLHHATFSKNDIATSLLLSAGADPKYAAKIPKFEFQ